MYIITYVYKQHSAWHCIHRQSWRIIFFTLFSEFQNKFCVIFHVSSTFNRLTRTIKFSSHTDIYNREKIHRERQCQKIKTNLDTNIKKLNDSWNLNTKSWVRLRFRVICNFLTNNKFLITIVPLTEATWKNVLTESSTFYY